MARISIVIPALNEAPAIVDQLKRLQPLRERGHEVIVVDGGSHDGSIDLARPWADQVVPSQPGRAAQMNLGARHAGGEILLFLHVDTRLPDAADALLARAAGQASPLWGWFAVRLDGQGWPYRLIETCMNLRTRLTRVCTGDHCLFVSRSLFEQVGGYPAIDLMEDVAISKRLRRYARPLTLRAPVITSSRRWQRDGIWRTVLLMWKLRLLYFLGAKPDALARQYYPADAGQKPVKS